MKLTKLTKAEFDARQEEECTQPGKKPVVKVYDGKLPVKLTFDTYDLPIEAGKYKWLVFVPCDLIGEHNWIRGFAANYTIGLKADSIIAPDGPRKAKIPAGEYKIIELENNGVLFAFH